MLTTAITAAIAAILSFSGVEPGPYLAGVWVVVFIIKAMLILGITFLISKFFRPAEPVPVPVTTQDS